MPVEIQLLKQDTEYLKREVADLKKQTTDGFLAINLKLDIMAEKYVRREEVDREFERVDKKIEEGLADTNKDVAEIKDNIKWAVRIVIGLVIVAVVGLVVIANK